MRRSSPPWTAGPRTGRVCGVGAHGTFLSIITGSFSSPAGDNPTVAMMEAAYAHHGIDATYLNCEVDADHLGDAVRGARAMGWAGFNCSMPHKVTVIDHLDRLADSARIIGAVNCVVADGDELVGENTDGKGFLRSLQSVTDVSGTRVVLLGAGGAARAIAVEVARAGAASLTVVARRPEQAGGLVEVVTRNTATACDAASWDGDYAVPAGTDVLVNATSVGLHPGGHVLPPVDGATLAHASVVADVIANPPSTAFLQAAQAVGCTTLDGLGMLVNQGAVAVRLWTGVDPDLAVMRRRVAEALHL